MKHCARVYTGPCHWCDRNTKQPPLKEAAFAVGDYCENTPIDQWDADEMAAIIKRELEKAVPARWGNDRDEAFNECRKLMGLE